MSKSLHQTAVDYLDEWCDSGPMASEEPYYTIKRTKSRKYRFTLRYDKAQDNSFRPLNITGPDRHTVRIMAAMHLKNGGDPWAAI